jgi:hypothetical protein
VGSLDRWIQRLEELYASSAGEPADKAKEAEREIMAAILYEIGYLGRAGRTVITGEGRHRPDRRRSGLSVHPRRGDRVRRQAGGRTLRLRRARSRGPHNNLGWAPALFG